MVFSSWVAHKTCGPITCSLLLFLTALTSAVAADAPRDRSGQAVFAESAVPAPGPGTEGASLDHLIAEALQNNPEVRAAR
jgi:hypothetical protein